MASDRFPESEIVAFCRAEWDMDPSDIQYPGGSGRKTVQVTVGGATYVVSKRSSGSRARLEGDVLSRLSDMELVPKLISRRENVVVQELVTGERLTSALERADAQGREDLLIKSGLSLLEAQIYAEKAGLNALVPRIGVRPNWKKDFANSPFRLAQEFGFDCSGYDSDRVVNILVQGRPSFVKWDARPGNAMLAENRLIWIDWEHCGLAATEDDLVWLMADEWTPISPDAEISLLTDFAMRREEDFEKLSQRFYVKAVLHCAIRASLIFRRKGEGPWWNPYEAMKHDRVGVTAAHVRRVCLKAERWAVENSETQMLVGLFKHVREMHD